MNFINDIACFLVNGFLTGNLQVQERTLIITPFFRFFNSQGAAKKSPGRRTAPGDLRCSATRHDFLLRCHNFVSFPPRSLLNKLSILGGKVRKGGREKRVVPPFAKKYLAGGVRMVQKKSPRRWRVLGIVARWLYGSDLADFGLSFLDALLSDVLHKRLFVNAKRQHLRRQVTRHVTRGLPIILE